MLILLTSQDMTWHLNTSTAWISFKIDKLCEVETLILCPRFTMVFDLFEVIFNGNVISAESYLSSLSLHLTLTCKTLLKSSSMFSVNIKGILPSKVNSLQMICVNYNISVRLNLSLLHPPTERQPETETGRFCWRFDSCCSLLLLSGLEWNWKIFNQELVVTNKTKNNSFCD